MLLKHLKLFASLHVTYESGLQILVTQQSYGKQVNDGDAVQVHYTGYLANGTKFDSSIDRGSPMSFNLTEGRVIAGFYEGIKSLRKGEKAVLFIPSNLGYGPRGYGGGVIPPNADLIFEIEVLNE